MVDLAKGEKFPFLGFEFRRIRSRRGVWRPHYTPKLKKRTELCGNSRRSSDGTNPNRWSG